MWKTVRDVGLASSAGRASGCWATRRSTAVRQNPGLTARDPPYGELTAIDQWPDHRTRGDVETPRLGLAARLGEQPVTSETPQEN